MRGKWLARLATTILALAGAASSAEPDSTGQNLERKLQLAEILLGKVGPQAAGDLGQELAELRQAATSEPPKSLVPRVDDFVRRVSDAYRHREGRAEVVEQRYRDRYLARLAEVERYKEGFDALVAQRGNAAASALDTVSFDGRIRRAEELANAERFSAAYPVLDGAYHQLLNAIKQVRDRETVEYRLEFLVPQDEYEYEQRRYLSQRTLIELALREGPASEQQGREIDRLVMEAQNRHDRASALAAQERYQEALAEEEAAVEVLTGALRRAGYFF
jgi:hypothetical protein